MYNGIHQHSKVLNIILPQLVKYLFVVAFTVFSKLKAVKQEWKAQSHRLCNEWKIYDRFCDNFISAWQLPDNWLTTAWRLPDDCLMTAWQLPDNCLTTAWQLPMKSLQQIPTLLSMKSWFCSKLQTRKLRAYEAVHSCTQPKNKNAISKKLWAQYNIGLQLCSFVVSGYLVIWARSLRFRVLTLL